MRRCEDVRIKKKCEGVKMFDRPPLLEEPFAQTLSGKNYGKIHHFQWENPLIISMAISNSKLLVYQRVHKFSMLQFENETRTPHFSVNPQFSL